MLFMIIVQQDAFVWCCSVYRLSGELLSHFNSQSLLSRGYDNP